MNTDDDAAGSPAPDPAGWALAAMSEAELSSVMRMAACHAGAALPPGTLFLILAFDPGNGAVRGPGRSQFISNCDRATMVRAMREAADRLADREEAARVPFFRDTARRPDTTLPGPGRDG